VEVDVKKNHPLPQVGLTLAYYANFQHSSII
jgi:hypothetical protein